MNHFPSAAWLLLSGALVLSCTLAQAQAGTPDENAVEGIVREFVRAGDRQDAGLAENVLSEHFRVVAVDFPEIGQNSVLPRAAFLNLLAQKKIGGVPRELEIVATRIASGRATAELRMESNALLFETTLLLIRENGSWRIVEDVTRAVPLETDG